MAAYIVRRYDDYGTYATTVEANCEANAILAVKKLDWARGYESYGYRATKVQA
jgi:hypothetical protein